MRLEAPPAPLKAIPLEGTSLRWVPWQIEQSIRQAGDFSEWPRAIPAQVYFAIELRGRPIQLSGPLRFLAMLNGFEDRAVQ
jgi:hypothetical protein